MVAVGIPSTAGTDEDIKKKEELEAFVLQLQTGDNDTMEAAVSSIRTELQTATSSMTSVPKPLKFLRPLFGAVAARYDSLPSSTLKKSLADILSVLATTAPVSELKTRRAMLNYRLEGSLQDLTSWGQEYMRNLTAEIAAEFVQRQKSENTVDDLMPLVNEIVPYYMKHNAECEAVDLLCEVDTIEHISEYVDKGTFQRVVLYLLSLSNYAASTDEFLRILRVTYDILMKQKMFPDALRVSMKMNNTELLKSVLTKCEDSVIKLQLALMCSRQGITYEFTPENSTPATKRVMKPINDKPPKTFEKKTDNEGDTNEKTETSYEGGLFEEEIVSLSGEEIESLCEELNRLASGDARSHHYLLLAKELDVLEPKLPEHVYKVHLEERRGGVGATLDSAKQNLAATFVNAFVNAGFCTDSLMTVEGSNWLYKNKDHGMLSAAASLGPLLLWNVSEGLSKIDKYQWSQDMNVKAGALMAFGLVSSGIRSDCDPAFALLSDQLETNNGMEKLGAVMGLGFAYGGTQRNDILECIIPIIIDATFTIECSAMAALSVGLIFVGSCNQEAAEAILQTIIERQGTKGSLDDSVARFLGVGLGLLYLGCRDSCEPTLSALEAIEHPIGDYCAITVEGFAFAGTGDVLKIQRMMQKCVERKETKPSDNSDLIHLNQAVAVLNIPLVAMAEEIGSEMSLRNMEHLLQYGELHLRQAVPLALALQSVSHPRPAVVDTLSKLSHDSDADVALHAIISLGLVGAGTNNSRIAGLLRQLAAFYSKDTNAMFVVRVAQGLLYMGKGLLTINPIHSDRFLINPVVLGSLLAVLHALMDLKTTILGRQHYLLFHLVPTMNPRMLITVDKNLNVVHVPVRVGQAVDTVGQAGRPKTITGFQTHTTPVLLTLTDRAELATEEYLPISSVMEGVVILEKNADYNSSRHVTQ